MALGLCFEVLEFRLIYPGGVEGSLKTILNIVEEDILED